jgi:hypothetical protein
MLGADWDQFIALLVVSIRMDFRGHRSIGTTRRKVSPFVWSIIFYSIWGLALSGALISKATPFLYSVLILTYSMAMMIFAVILEFGNTIISPDDTEVLAFRPIASRTYFLAKLSNLFFYVILVGLALCIGPSFLGLAVKGSNWSFPLVFIMVATVANLTASAFVILVYTGLLKIMPYERFKDLLAYIQTGFAFLIFFFYQLIPRISGDFFRQNLEMSGQWLYVAPPAWYAGVVQLILGKGRPADIWLAVLAGVATVLLFGFSFRRISLQYVSQIAVLQSKKKTKQKQASSQVNSSRTKTGVPFLAKILRHPETVAGYTLASTLLKRDRWVKMTLYPTLGFPLAFLVLAIIQKDITDPYTSQASSQFGMSYMVVFFVFFMVYMMVMGVRYSQEWEASWIFHAAPLASPGRFLRGVQWMLLTRLMIPFFLILGIIYGTQIPWIHALQHTFSLFILGLVVFATSLLMVKEYPFSKKREKGERTQQFSFLFILTPFFILVVILQLVVYRFFIGWLAAQMILLGAFFIMQTWAVRRLNRRLKGQEYFH